MLRKIVILRGLPGSGKTTWAKNLMKKHPGEYKRVNKDDLRAMIDNGKWSRGNEKFILKIRNDIILRAITEGYNTIVDDTNLAPKHIEQITKIATGLAEVEIKDFTDVKVETCIKRDLLRDRSVGKDIILEMYNQFLKPEKKKIQYDEHLNNCVICDIDGTLALMINRGPFDWNKVNEDKLNIVVEEILGHRDVYTKIILVSGRDSCCRDLTKKWLIDKGISYYDKLYMRSEGDNRDDRIIKEEIYNKHIKDQYNVLFVLDDRPKMVRHWKDLGLFVLDCNQGDSRIDF